MYLPSLKKTGQNFTVLQDINACIVRQKTPEINQFHFGLLYGGNGSLVFNLYRGFCRETNDTAVNAGRSDAICECMNVNC